MSTELPGHGRYEHDPLPTPEMRIKAHLHLPFSVMEDLVVRKYPDLDARRSDVRVNVRLCMTLAMKDDLRPEDFLFIPKTREHLIAAVAAALGKHG